MRITSTPLRRAAIPLAVAGALCLVPAEPALAHARLLKSSPAKGANMDALTELTLVFSDQLNGHPIADRIPFAVTANPTPGLSASTATSSSPVARADEQLKHDGTTHWAVAGGADPGRLKVLVALLDGEMCVGDLAAVAGSSESAVSPHLRLLRAHRAVYARRAGRMAHYRLADAHVRTLLELALTHIGHAPAGAHPERADSPAETSNDRP